MVSSGREGGSHLGPREDLGGHTAEQGSENRRDSEMALALASVTGDQLIYPFREPPAIGEPVEILPDFYWLRMRVPFALDHVNLWLIRDGRSSFSVIDTGYHDPDTIGIWAKLLSGSFSGAMLDRILLTHFHPDHSGMAGWLVERTGAALLMNRTEWLTGGLLALEPAETAWTAQRDFYARAGFPVQEREHQLRAFNSLLRGIQPMPQPFRSVREGDRFLFGGAEWISIVTPGHAPGHVCLYSPKHRVLIAGDQVLPRVTPNISVDSWEPEADPLGEFLGSLRRVAGLPDDVLVLPSHGLPFIGLKSRVRELRSHHEERLTALVHGLAEDSTAFEAMPILFSGPLVGYNQLLALGETIAHLNHLVVSGKLKSARGCDGVLRFRKEQLGRSSQGDRPIFP